MLVNVWVWFRKFFKEINLTSSRLASSGLSFCSEKNNVKNIYKFRTNKKNFRGKHKQFVYSEDENLKVR
jgi:hypothetical protein